MSMPKGFKSRKGYATITEIPGGMDYRRIAERMSADGDKMNHATARNVFLKAMMKIAGPIHELYQMDTSEDSVMRTAKDPEFQAGVVDMLDEYGPSKI
jgi:hypothetical protein